MTEWRIIMVWGSFGFVHILSLFLSAGMIVGLYFFLRHRSEKVQTALLGVLSFAGIAAIFFNLFMWGSPLEYLPFHLCSLTAMVLPFAVFTKNKILNNLLLLWGFGALLALVVNDAQANFEIASLTFWFYYLPHTLEFGVIVLMFLLKRAVMDVRCILPTVGSTFAVYTCVHFINLLVNAHCAKHRILDWAGDVVRVNYMYSLFSENPVLDLLYTVPYWYMFGTIPIIAVYLSLVYCRQIVGIVRAYRAKKHRATSENCTKL